MRILIADDEKLVRYSLKSMLGELSLPFEVVDEASNGEEMVRLIKRHKPDLAFVDIKMPKLDGLEAIKESKEFSPDTDWVILTGFSEFEFAKTAINLGVSNYLLKPVSLQELGQVMGDISEKSKKKALIRNREFESEISAVCHDLVVSEDLDNQGSGSGFKYICAVFICDSYMDEKFKSRRQAEFYNEVRSLINETSVGDTRIALFLTSDGEIATAAAWRFSSGNYGERCIRTYLRRLDEIIRRFNRDELKISTLLSDECRSYELVRKKLNQLQNLSVLRCIAGIGRVITINELAQMYQESSSGILELCNTLVRISYAYSEKEYLSYMRLIDTFKKLLAAFASNTENSIKKSISNFISCSVNCNIDLNSKPDIVARYLSSHGEKLLKESKEGSRASQIVNQVIDFIERNYTNDIGIGDIAEKLDVTPNYLSSLFHRQEGTTFLKYLTGIRMLKAKELLVNSSLQVQQVAEQVGYYSTRHFTKLFKEFHGFYPSECQKTHKTTEG